MTIAFDVSQNDPGTPITVTAARAAGASTILVSGWPSSWTEFPMVLTATRSGNLRAFLRVTGQAAGTLSGATAVEGPDASLAIGDLISCRPTAGNDMFLKEVINSLHDDIPVDFDDSDFVHIEGTEEINGAKTFTEEIHVGGTLGWEIILGNNSFGADWGVITTDPAEGLGSFALACSMIGGTILNAPAGKTLSLSIANAVKMRLDPSGNVTVSTGHLIIGSTASANTAHVYTDGTFAHVTMEGVAGGVFLRGDGRHYWTNQDTSVIYGTIDSTGMELHNILTFLALTSTSSAQPQAKITPSWSVDTHASRKGRLSLSVADYTGVDKEGITIESDGVRAVVTMPGRVAPVTTAVDGTTITFDCAVTDWHPVTLGATRILAVTNDSTRQSFFVELIQGGSGSNTVTWWSGIKWVAGTVPTLTTTVGKADIFGFRKTGTGAYYGFVVGQNL